MCGAKESISAEVIDCSLELEENVNDLGASHGQGVPDVKKAPTSIERAAPSPDELQLWEPRRGQKGLEQDTVWRVEL